MPFPPRWVFSQKRVQICLHPISLRSSGPTILSLLAVPLLAASSKTKPDCSAVRVMGTGGQTESYPFFSKKCTGTNSPQTPRTGSSPSALGSVGMTAGAWRRGATMQALVLLRGDKCLGPARPHAPLTCWDCNPWPLRASLLRLYKGK